MVSEVWLWLFEVLIKIGSKYYTIYITEMWYFGHRGLSRFQTDQSTTQNRHLTQNDDKFKWSVFIFLYGAFHAFVLTKF